MIALSKSSKTVAALAALVLPVTAGAQAQELEPQGGANSGGEPMTVVGTTPSDLSGMPEGPAFAAAVVSWVSTRTSFRPPTCSMGCRSKSRRSNGPIAG